MIKVKTQKNKGFIALIAVIIISTILLGLVFTVSQSSFSSRTDSLNTEFKRISRSLAESCMNKALLYLAQNYYYIPKISGDSITVAIDSQGRSETCIIKSVSTATPETNGKKMVTIITQGKYVSAWSTVSGSFTVASTSVASLLSPNIIVNSWKESTTTN